MGAGSHCVRCHFPRRQLPGVRARHRGLMKELYPAAQATPRPKWLTPFGLVTLVVFVAIQVLAFRNSPPDALMGNLQKIMYVHVPAAWASMLAFFVVFVMSIAYL